MKSHVFVCDYVSTSEIFFDLKTVTFWYNKNLFHSNVIGNKTQPVWWHLVNTGRKKVKFNIGQSGKVDGPMWEVEGGMCQASSIESVKVGAAAR